jgi:hypothetical protein
MSTTIRLLAVLLLASLSAGVAAAQTRVDLELVLAVDISLSMDLEEQRLQRDGYIAAFRDPEIQRAIRSGAHGRIAVAYLEWAGPASQHVVVPWTLIDSPAAANAFASELERMQISRARMTSISAALDTSGRLLKENAFKGERQVIDVPGDGPNNAGRPVSMARDELVGNGITINGLPILLRTGQPSGNFDLSQLDAYYEACVIGGPGAFVIPVRERQEFASAIRRKLLIEISGIVLEPRLIPAQAPASAPYADCMVGERQWQRYMDSPWRN